MEATSLTGCILSSLVYLFGNSKLDEILMIPVGKLVPLQQQKRQRIGEARVRAVDVIKGVAANEHAGKREANQWRSEKVGDTQAQVDAQELFALSDVLSG